MPMKRRLLTALAFLLFLSMLPVSVLAQKIWAAPVQELPVARISALWAGLCCCAGVVALCHGGSRPLPPPVLLPTTAAGIAVAVGLNAYFARSGNAPQIMGAAPGASIEVSGLLLGCCVLAAVNRRRGERNGTPRAAWLLPGLVALAAAADLLYFHVQVPPRGSFPSLAAYRAAFLSLPLLFIAITALPLPVLLPRRAVPLPLAVLSLCVALFPFGMIGIMLSRDTGALPPMLNAALFLSFGPTAAAYGLFLGLAAAGFLPPAKKPASRGLGGPADL